MLQSGLIYGSKVSFLVEAEKGPTYEGVSMKIKNALVACAATVVMAFGAVALTGCGPSDEEVIREGVTAQLEAIKTLDPALLDELSKGAGTAEMAAYGIEPKEFVTSYLAGFDYRVDEITVDGDKAQANVVLTCKSLKEFEKAFTEATQALASYEAVANMTEAEITSKIGQTIMDTLGALQPVETAPIAIGYELKDDTWAPDSSAEKAVSDALFGN